MAKKEKFTNQVIIEAIVAMQPKPVGNAVKNSKPVIIMGVDPGTVIMGFSVIACYGQKIEMLSMDTLKMSYTHDVFERLQRIYQTMDEAIARHKPTQFAIEAPFFGKNVQSSGGQWLRQCFLVGCQNWNP